MTGAVTGTVTDAVTGAVTRAAVTDSDRGVETGGVTGAVTRGVADSDRGSDYMYCVQAASVELPSVNAEAIPLSNELHTDVHTSEHTNISYVAGTISQEKLTGFMRMLWFTCRGNVLVRHVPIDEHTQTVSVTFVLDRNTVFIVVTAVIFVLNCLIVERKCVACRRVALVMQ